MEHSSSTSLLWIEPYTSDAPSNQSRQRREVMKKVASRRKEMHQRCHPNRRQLPIFVHNQDPGGSSARQLHKLNPNNAMILARDSNLHAQHLQTSLTQLQVASVICPPMLAKCELDFLELSSLAALEVGRFTGQRVLESPRSIAHFLGGKNWSYCRYVPSYYAESVLVRNATDCVVARVRCLLSPKDSTWETLALASYSMALSNLQDAINSTCQPPKAEVLCGTLVLSLYEVNFYILPQRICLDVFYSY